jgi:hypothetical protein
MLYPIELWAQASFFYYAENISNILSKQRENWTDRNKGGALSLTADYWD